MKKATWRAVGAVVALGAGLLWAVAGCDKLPDAAWLRITGFQKTGTSENSSYIDVVLDEPPSTTTLNASLENHSVIVGSEDSVGIDVYQTHVQYSSADFPAFDFPVTLYLAGTHTASTTGTSTGTSAGTIAVPIAPASLKSWIRAHRTVPASGLAMSARVTFKARTDEGRELVSSGGLVVNFINEPFSPSARARF